MSSLSHLLRAMMWIVNVVGAQWIVCFLFLLLFLFSHLYFCRVLVYRRFQNFECIQCICMIHFYVNIRGVCLWYTLILLSLFQWLCNWFNWQPTLNNGHFYFHYNFYAAQIQIFVSTSTFHRFALIQNRKNKCESFCFALRLNH